MGYFSFCASRGLISDNSDDIEKPSYILSLSQLLPHSTCSDRNSVSSIGCNTTELQFDEYYFSSNVGFFRQMMNTTDFFDTV
jgi:hypothetical protein